MPVVVGVNEGHLMLQTPSILPLQAPLIPNIQLPLSIVTMTNSMMGPTKKKTMNDGNIEILN